MKQEATIINNNKIKLENGEIYPISKNQKNHGYPVGQRVLINIDTEYPEACDNDPFCMGDETCIVCLCNNKVAKLFTKI